MKIPCFLIYSGISWGNWIIGDLNYPRLTHHSLLWGSILAVNWGIRQGRVIGTSYGLCFLTAQWLCSQGKKAKAMINQVLGCHPNAGEVETKRNTMSQMPIWTSQWISAELKSKTTFPKSEGEKGRERGRKEAGKQLGVSKDFLAL